MRSSAADHRPSHRILRCSPAGLAALLCGAALAQQGSHVMVFESDGSGPQVLHYTGPDLNEVRKPDFDRRDLPTFNEKLDLDEMQRLVVQTLLDVYLAAFKARADQILPAGGMAGLDMTGDGEGGQMAAGGGGGEAGVGRIVQDALDDVNLTDVDVDADGSGEVSIRVGAFIADGAPPEGMMEGGEFTRHIEIETGDEAEPDGDRAAPSANVFISVGGGDDIELSDEDREKLEKMAKEMAAKIQQKLDQAQLEGDDGALLDDMTAENTFAERQQYFDDLRDSTRKFQHQKEALRQQFVTEVQSQLSAEQLGMWPGLERALTRRKTLPNGRLDGERTDLTLIAAGFDAADQQQAFPDRLAEYELALHQALLERNAYIADANSRLDEAIQDGKAAKALAIVDQATRLRVAVRSVNERYADLIGQQMTAQDGAAFRRSFLKNAYPRVYRRTRANKALQAILKLDELDADTLAAANALADAYNAELEPANERLREAIHRYQPAESRRMVERLSAMMEGGTMSFGSHDEDDPIHAAFQRRTDLDERFMKQCYALLTPEQVADLPKLPSEAKRRQPVIIGK